MMGLSINDDVRCGTCKYWINRICRLNGLQRDENEMKKCIGWKKVSRKNGRRDFDTRKNTKSNTAMG